MRMIATRPMTALETAKHMAKYSHRDWLYWRTDEGNQGALKKTGEAVAEAIAAVGPQGSFFVIGATDGNLWKVHPAIHHIVLGNARIGI